MIFCPQFANSPRNFCHLRQLTECNIHPTPYTTFNTLFTFSCSAMLRHSRRAGHRAGDFHAKISGQDMPVKTQGAGFYESAQDFSLFYFFLFLRCLSGYLFFADNHSMYSIGKERCQPPYSDGETPYFSLKHLAKYDAVVKPTLYMTSVTDSLPCAR